MSKALDSQRTYALIGTGGCGKTSLAEMLLFQSGLGRLLLRLAGLRSCFPAGRLALLKA